MSATRVLIRRPVTVDDEAMHAVQDHPQFNESALLTFFDTEAREGGYLRIGNRPNEGHAEATLCWFLSDGSALFSFERAQIAGNGGFDAGGVAITVSEPGRVLRATYQGDCHHLASPRLLQNPKAAFATSARVPVRLDLTFTGISPLYGGEPFPGLEVGGHYEQHMSMTGSLAVEGAERAVRGLGNRDHSWGPRVWQATHADRTYWCTFGPDLGVALSITWRSPFPDVYEVIGQVWRDGEMTPIVDASASSEFEDPERLFHKAFIIRLHTARGEDIVLHGRALAIAPLRHRRDTRVTHIGWGMAEFRWGERVGLGLAEYLDVSEAPAG